MNDKEILTSMKNQSKKDTECYNYYYQIYKELGKEKFLKNLIHELDDEFDRYLIKVNKASFIKYLNK